MMKSAFIGIAAAFAMMLPAVPAAAVVQNHLSNQAQTAAAQTDPAFQARHDRDRHDARSDRRYSNSRHRSNTRQRTSNRRLSAHQRACSRRYSSYNPRTDRYRTRRGQWVRCRL